jgi:carboxymethylenebutenolidase
VGNKVSFASNGDTAQGYLALPEAPGPGVVLIQEWWGLVPHIADVADRLAAEGFVVLAPDLYAGESTTEPDEAGKKLMALDLPRAGRDMAGAAAYLSSREDVTGSGIGAVGFCMGGGLAILAATVSEDITAAVGFYPAIHWEGWAPDWSRLSGKRVDMHLAEGDGGSAADQVQETRAAIEAAGAYVELYDYPGTEHAFFNDARPEVYHPEAAATAWDRTLDTLRTELVKV